MSTMTRTSRTIRLSRETYDDLSKRGSVADTFDDVIQQLLKRDKIPVQVQGISK